MNNPATVAAVGNGVAKLSADIHLSESTVAAARLDASPGDKPTLAERLAPFIGIGTDLPPDLAANHDHYLHGAPKQQP